VFPFPSSGGSSGERPEQATKRRMPKAIRVIVVRKFRDPSNP
jgi:hypothetical protein